MPQDADLTLAQALASSHEGRGRVVILAGPSGRGMSHRIRGAAQRARDRGMHVAVASGRPAERALAFSVAVELFEPLWRAASAFDVALGDGPAGAAIRLLDGADPPAEGDGSFAVIRGMWALAHRLAAQPSAASAVSPPRPTGRPRGLAVVIDDLHDVDGPSLGLLAYAAQRLDSLQITILASCRVDIEPCAPAALAAISRAASVVTPEPLDAGAGIEVVRALMPGASTRFAGACVAVCGGNAALLRALVNGLLLRGWSGSSAEAPRVGAILPEEVAVLAAERTSRLPAAARALLRAVATSDRPTSVEHAAVSAGLLPDAAFAAFDALITSDILLDELPLAFAQPILGKAVHDSLTSGQRGLLAPRAEALTRAADRRVDLLTPSEVRVAKLAARGMTTRQIAATLFVTPKTVEFHLRNTYRKLEVPSSRSELVRALEAADLAPVPAVRS